MRDPCPFQRNFVVRHHLRPEIQPVERQVLLTQRVGCQRLAVFRRPPHLQLKLGKHRLPVHGALELVEEVVDQIGAFLLVLRLPEQVAHQQDLVARRGHLGHKNHVVSRAGRLVFCAVVAVQGMPHLMGEGEHAVQRVLVVEQHIRVRIAVARGIRSAPLALVFVHVDPPAGKPFLQQIGVVLSQHGERLEHGALCLLKRDLHRRILHHGGVHVVHVQLVHTQQLFAQRHIAVHLVQVSVHRLNQVGVDLRLHLVGVERGLQRAAVVPRVCKELQLPELRVQRRGDGVFHLSEAGVIGLKGIFAQDAVGALQQRHKRAGRQRVRAALAVRYVGEAQIRIPQHAADVIRRARHLSRGGQQGLFRCREHMRLQPPHGVDWPAVGLQCLFLGKEPVHRLVRDGDDLRRGKGGCARNGHIHAHGLAAHVEIKAVGGVLVQLLRGVADQLGQAHRQLVAHAVIPQQRLRALAQVPGKGGNLFRHLLQRFIFRFPRLIGREDILQPPGVLHRDLCPYGYFLFCHMISTSVLSFICPEYIIILSQIQSE